MGEYRTVLLDDRLFYDPGYVPGKRRAVFRMSDMTEREYLTGEDSRLQLERI
jgi:hypothetical protein